MDSLINLRNKIETRNRLTHLEVATPKGEKYDSSPGNNYRRSPYNQSPS